MKGLTLGIYSTEICAVSSSVEFCTNSVEVHTLQRSTICTIPHFTHVHTLRHRATLITVIVTNLHMCEIHNCLHSAQVNTLQNSPLCPHFYSAHFPTLHVPILHRSPICKGPCSAQVSTLHRSPLRSTLCKCRNSA